LGFLWLRIGASGGLLWIRYWTSEFNKMRGISWLAEELVAFEYNFALWSQLN
jgi:hypothetical protein